MIIGSNAAVNIQYVRLCVSVFAQGTNVSFAIYQTSYQYESHGQLARARENAFILFVNFL